jgi:hypothetical protein
MQELTINLHIHTSYSDGSGSYHEVARAALNAGIDVLLVTDHNVLVQGVDAYYRDKEKRTLLIAGEEVHDQAREPQKNHLLVFGANRELATLASTTQELINAVRQAGGICFLAHPIDPALPAFGETDISWIDWDARDYTGIELWNGFSELKTVVKSKAGGLFYAFFPEAVARGPIPGILQLWDRLLASGERVLAIGGSDAHALQMSLGPLHRTIYPYAYHFSAVNTHLLVPEPLSGDVQTDKQMIFQSMAAGRCFIGYDLPAATRGFRFSAQGRDGIAEMGGTIAAQGTFTLQVVLPAMAEVFLLRNGQILKTAFSETMTHFEDRPGIYRVEVYRRFLAKKRGWIFSNPIFVV